MQVKQRTVATSGKYKLSGKPVSSNVTLDECRQSGRAHVTLNWRTPMLLSLVIVGGGMG